MGNGICVPFRPMPDQKPVQTRCLGGFSVLFHFRTLASLPCLAIFSIKYDLARSCFQLWPKIGNEGDKISRKKTGEALAETVFSEEAANNQGFGFAKSPTYFWRATNGKSEGG